MSSDGGVQEALQSLRDLVKLTQYGNTVQQATYAALTHGAAGSGGGAGGRGTARIHPALPQAPLIGNQRGGPRAKPINNRGGFIGRVKRAFEDKRGRANHKMATSGWARTGRKIGGLIGGSKGSKIGGMVGMGAGASVAAVKAIAEVVKGFIAARDAVNKWTDEAMATAKRLSEVSGSMAGVTAERDIRQMQRDMQRGEATAGTANELMAAESNRKDQENRLNIVVDNAKNSVLVVLNNILAEVLRPIVSLVEGIAKKIGIEGKPVPPSGWAAEEGDIMSSARAVDRAGKNLMDAARAAAMAGSGASAPSGAAPMGRLP